MSTEITREEIVNILRDSLEPRDSVLAMWEGGAAAWGRVDEWSDIDLLLCVQDDFVEETFDLVENVLSGLSTIELRYRLPEPTWHGHSQVFYRLADTSPFCMIDLVIQRESGGDRFIQPELHGKALVHFDKAKILTSTPLDRQELIERLKKRLDEIKVNFELFQILALKELNRGNAAEAISFYLAFTVRPLIEVVRMKYTPAQSGFNTRYVYYDLPSEWAERIENLMFVRDVEDLSEKHKLAKKLFWEFVADLHLDKIEV